MTIPSHFFWPPLFSHSLNWKDILRPVLNTIRSLCRERMIQRRVHLLASAEDRKKKPLIVKPVLIMNFWRNEFLNYLSLLIAQDSHIANICE